MEYPQLGDYEVLSHAETPECSLRLLKLEGERAVRPHSHHRTTQTYLMLEGKAEATVGDIQAVLKPYQTLRVPSGSAHSIRARGQALVLSVSVPPLEPDDHDLGS